MQVVVVESPAKAKTINKYLGSDFTVLASYGHVRDLPAKDGSVDPNDDFSMKWEVQSGADKRLKEIATALKTADGLVLATDPDREGEAISWHIEEEMRRRKVLKDKPVQRVVFNEITKRAVLEAFNHPRQVDAPLVEAYLARRALDYLVGFNLSPILWRKLPGSRSAGRVQSVALRLICEREAEIEVFKPQAYWTFNAQLDAKGSEFSARLTHIQGKKLQKMSVGTKERSEEIMSIIRGGGSYSVSDIEKKQVKRHPAPPFTTSTLQQEASRKLGFSNSHTMSVAQKLYEGISIDGETVGLITYMRTDGLQLSSEAVGQARSYIKSLYGEEYVPAEARFYKSKAKNAQEAHEAIRPTDPARAPESIRTLLTLDQ
ncbi:MAG: type I DNA topoisomerase, partial [Alphaproteobacteria bacterium]